MNNRDPFNLRRSPGSTLLRSNSYFGRKESPEKKDKGLEESLAPQPSSSMSSYAPPSFNGPTHRHPDQWQSSKADGHTNGSVSEKITGMFNSDRKEALPMYKDKPYAHLKGGKRMPWFRRKRTMGLILATLAGLSWWFGVLSPLSYFSGNSDGLSARKSKSLSWFGSSTGTDWDDRAEQVKQAFKTSFADYEKHGWGT